MKEMRSVLYEILGENLSCGEVLRGSRVRAGLSQDELGQITGIIRSNISALENDRMPMTSHYALIFSSALDVHPSDFLFPNGKFIKTKEMKEIEKRAKALVRKRG